MVFFTRMFRNKEGFSLESTKDVFSQNAPCDYIVIDIETSSLNSRKAEIIEVSAIKVYKDQIVDDFTRLIRPTTEPDPKALAVNNILIDDLLTADRIETVLPAYINYLGDNKLVGYNISSFDLPILRRYASGLNLELTNAYDDVLYSARRKIPQLPNHKLTSIASYLLIDTNGAHRALRDCEITNMCYKKINELPDAAPLNSNNGSRARNPQTIMLQELKALVMGILSDGIVSADEVITLSSWLNAHNDLIGTYPYDRISIIVNDILSDGIIENFELEELKSILNDYLKGSFSDSCKCEIPGKTFVLTGDFKSGSKDEIKNLISDHGGIVKNSVSGKTNYVVIGKLGSPAWSYGNYGTKVQRAKELKDAGNDIQIISEDDLMPRLR